MNYENYDIDDFLKDEFFVQWVIQPDSQSDFFWQRWINSHHKKKKIVMKAREIILSMDYKNRFVLEQHKADKIFESILNEKNKAFSFYQKKPVYKTLMKIAASFLLLLGIGYALWNNTINEKKEQVVAEEIPVEWLIRNVPAGEKATLKLTDGTIVNINSMSTLEFQKSFPSDKRLVKLEGEAFFEIPKSENITFQVITNESVTTVLGTKFNVLSYPEDNNVTVTVAEGEVSLRFIDDTSSDPLIITEKQKGVIGRGISPSLTEVKNLNVYLGWTRGELVFEQAPLRQIVRKLERWYDIEIELEESDADLTNKRLTATFSQNQSVDDVLQSISLAIDLPIEEVDSSINKYKLFSKP